MKVPEVKAGQGRGRKVALAITLLFAPVLILILINLFAGSDRRLERPPEVPYAVSDAQFIRDIGLVTASPLVPGNSVAELHNGVQIFPAMLAAIRSARSSITFETFIYWSGRVGRDFAEALAERARAGIPVHVILDAVGIDKVDEEHLRLMEQAGVQVRRYKPLHWYTLTRINNRTHRKILVVDGRTGFTGGAGVADMWLGDADSPEHWRDSHFRVTGPAVAQLQAAFLDNWLEVEGTALHGERYAPAAESAGSQLGQVVISSPSTGSESLRLMYLTSIAAARRRILMANAYFVPDDVARETILAARRRGVEIDLIVPGTVTDAVVTRHASRSRWGPLLEAGVRIHEYQPTMMHAKVMIVDGVWTSVGSANFDNRSFRLNDEVNLNIHDSAFAARQEEVFAADLARSRRISLEEWRDRPLTEKLKEHLAGLLRTQL